MKIRISHIQAASRVDGPGVRAVLFVQGCTLACKGCQNTHLWPSAGGREEEVEDVAESLAFLARDHGNVSVSGGEPMQQPAALAELLLALRRRGVKHIVVYTGYRWEELWLAKGPPCLPQLMTIMEQIDVLVDGRFEARQDDPLIAWRGSRNQRPLHVPYTLDAWVHEGAVVTVSGWDDPVVEIDPAGDLLLPIGLEPVLGEAGQVKPTRRCGETGRPR